MINVHNYFVRTNHHIVESNEWNELNNEQLGMMACLAVLDNNAWNSYCDNGKPVQNKSERK